MKRYKHGLSHNVQFTGKMGELIPISVYEALPGDTIQQATSALVRIAPLVAPVMHPVTVRIHSWAVPTRLLWDGWEEFITGGPDGQGGSSGAYPVIDSGGSGFAAGGLLDHMGIPPGVPDFEVDAIPVRAYNKVFNECYRDEDLITEVSEDSVDMQRIAWEKDHFTMARPWPQKGPDVTLPLGTRAPVRGIGKQDQTWQTGPTTVYETDGSGTESYAKFQPIDPGANATNFRVEEDPDNAGYPNIWADLANATAVTIDDVREAFALQRYQEARARYGSRYVEYLKYLSVNPADARLQRPEYLGGGKQVIQFSEVLQTGVDSTDQGLGNLGGHGIAGMRSRRWRKFFQEHCIVLTLMSVRPKTIYMTGVNRMWNRRTKEDYWQKELQHIGMQEVLNKEIYAQGSASPGDDDSVFGYQDRYAEYRRIPSRVAGDFRSTLNFWNMARDFTSLPTLNQDFVECDPPTRIYADQNSDHLWVMTNHSVQARRLVSRSAEGGIR